MCSALTTTPQDVADLLGRRLAWWGGASVLLGSAAAVVSTPAVRAFGIQTAGWGAIDLVIAGIGALKTEPAERKSLRRLLLVNAALDIGYIAGGAHLVYRKPTLWGRVSPDEAVGHGTAVIVQGAALLVLDTLHASKLGLA